MFNVQSEGLHGYDFFKEIVQNYELLNEVAFGGGFLAFTRRDTDLRVPTCGSQRGMKYSHKDAKSTKVEEIFLLSIIFFVSFVPLCEKRNGGYIADIPALLVIYCLHLFGINPLHHIPQFPADFFDEMSSVLFLKGVEDRPSRLIFQYPFFGELTALYFG